MVSVGIEQWGPLLEIFGSNPVQHKTYFYGNWAKIPNCPQLTPESVLKNAKIVRNESQKKVSKIPCNTQWLTVIKYKKIEGMRKKKIREK